MFRGHLCISVKIKRIFEAQRGPALVYSFDMENILYVQIVLFYAPNFALGMSAPVSVYMSVTLCKRT